MSAALLPPGKVLAASITVDKTADDDTNGSCTLWDAITAANTDTATNGCTAGSGADTITLAVNITLSNYLPDITSEITIEGANYDIDGNDEYPIFYVDDGNLTVNNITLTGGRRGAYGGAIDADGGSLTVTNSRLEDNSASLLGGAIATSNTDVIIMNSVFVGNYSGSLGGALSFFTNDPDDEGMPEDFEAATLLIDKTTFGEDTPSGCAAADISADPENEAENAGGALDLAGGKVTIRRSSFIGNKAGTDGGAIHASVRDFLFENNTISCNTADADGGGMYVIVGDLILRHNTIYQNSAGDEGGGLYSIDDSQHYPEDVEVTWGLYLQNSIIAGSKSGGDCVAQDEIDHNIGMYVGDGTCEPACSAQDGPINLGELQGEPAYHPLQDGSVAINRADVEVCSLPGPTETPDSANSQAFQSQQAQDLSDTNICEQLAPQQDQIGTNRPMYGNCDIGAIESRTGEEHIGPRDVTPTPTPTNTVDAAATERILQETRDAAATHAAQTAVQQTEDARDRDAAATQTALKQTQDAEATNAAATQTAAKQTEDAADNDAERTAVKQTQDAEATNAAATQTAVKQTEDAADNDAERTAVKQTQDAEATDAAQTATAAFELTDSAEWTEIALTQTAAKSTEDAGATETVDAHATETAIANLPPAEQTGTAEAFATETAAAAPTRTEEAEWTQTAAAALTATASALPLATLDGSITPSPTGSPGPETRCTHVVVYGDTLFALAQSYGTTIAKFRALNQLPDNALYVGQELIVPDCYDPERDDLESATLGFSCQNLFDSAVVRTTSRVVNCRVVNAGAIDKHPALASGIIAALDILGYVETGVEVCFRSVGALVFLDAVTDPPTPRSIDSYGNALDMTCGEVDEVGTLVLVAPITERDTYLELTSCQITTTQTLRLRTEADGADVVGLVPYSVTLDTTARTRNWFRVTFLGKEGWISAAYVEKDGICD